MPSSFISETIVPVEAGFDAVVFRIYFQRGQGRGKLPGKSRWWIHSIEDCPGNIFQAD